MKTCGRHRVRSLFLFEVGGSGGGGIVGSRSGSAASTGRMGVISSLTYVSRETLGGATVGVIVRLLRMWRSKTSEGLVDPRQTTLLADQFEAFKHAGALGFAGDGDAEGVDDLADLDVAGLDEIV